MVKTENESGAAHRRMEQMEKGDLDSMESMQRTMRMCTVVGVVLCVCVVVASMLLWDNMGFGSSGLDGYDVSRAAGVSAVAGASENGHVRLRQTDGGTARDKHERRRLLVRRASSAKRLQQARIKKKLAARALDLAEKAVINEVAAKYAPASFLAAHRRPEAAAIRDITSSRAAADRVQDRVEGEMIDEHYGGRTNDIAYQVKMELPHMSRAQRNSLIEDIAAAATSHAMHHMAGLVDKQWVDHGLGEKKSAGWIQDQIKGNIENAPAPAPPPAQASRQDEGADSTNSGMSLPGLGRVSSPDQAAKALARLAAKSGDLSARSSHQGEGSRTIPHTLHAALKSRMHADGLDSDGGNDLHSALERELTRRGAMHTRPQWMRDIRRRVSSALSGHHHGGGWDDLSRTRPVGQSISKYFSKANQNWMNAAGAWGAGA